MFTKQLGQIGRQVAEQVIDDVVESHGDELIDKAFSAFAEKLKLRLEVTGDLAVNGPPTKSKRRGRPRKKDV